MYIFLPFFPKCFFKLLTRVAFSDLSTPDKAISISRMVTVWLLSVECERTRDKEGIPNQIYLRMIY